jgi:multisubunit Na+/H+ antiporter MnhG subunit
MAEARTRTARWWLFRTPESAGAIYGTIAAMAVIAGSAKSSEHGEALGLTIATLLVFWLAHVYAHALAHHLRGAKRLDWSAVRVAMAEEWSLLQGPVPLLVLLVLGELGVLEERQAVRLALWLGVVELVTWGILYARRQRWSWVTALTAGAVNGLFGLVIVVLEVVVH